MTTPLTQRPLLVGSLALNLFLAGLVVAPFLQPHRPFGPPMRPPSPERMIEEVARTLPPEDATKLRAIFAQHGAAIEAHHLQMGKSMTEIELLMKAPQPDIPALQAVLDRMNTDGEGLHKNMSALILSVARELPQASRLVLVAKLAHGPRGEFRPPQGGPGPQELGPQAREPQGEMFDDNAPPPPPAPQRD